MAKYISTLVEMNNENKDLEKFWLSQSAWPDGRFKWFYSDNGYGVPDTAILKLDDDTKVVGCCSYFSRQFVVGGEEILAGVNCDALVDQKHRTLGPALMLMNKLVATYPARGLAFVLGFPNDKSKPLVARCGYSEIGKFYRWSRVLNYQKSNAGLLVKWLYRALVVVANPIIGVVSGEYFYKFLMMLKRYDLKPAVFADLQRDYIERCPELIRNYGKRSQAYIAWRYSEVADHLNYELVVIQKKNKTIGYLVYSMDQGIAVIHDISLLEVKDFKYALVAFIGIAKKQHANSISIGFLGCDQYEKVLKHLYFIRRESRSVMFHSGDEVLMQKLKDTNGWYLMNGDVDL